MQRALAGARLSLIALLAAALSAGLGLMPLPGAATAADSGNAAHLHAYTYDAKPASASPPQATTERPPTAIDDTAYSAVDRWSGGASARFGSAATLGAHTYDDTARLAQVASGIAPTETSGRATCRPSVAFHRHGVAANAGGSALVRYDAMAASRTLLGQVGEGYAVTPAGRTISAHAAERIVYGAPGRSPTTLSRIDDILNNPTRTMMRDNGTMRIYQGKDWVAIRDRGPIHIVTVMVR